MAIRRKRSRSLAQTSPIGPHLKPQSNPLVVFASNILAAKR
jgi:hypothetical protein